ncbi:unnamed protein product [Camellia sinensis]
MQPCKTGVKLMLVWCNALFYIYNRLTNQSEATISPFLNLAQNACTAITISRRPQAAGTFKRDKLMTQAISSLGVEWYDRWNDGRSSRVAWVFKLITETEPSVYLWAYILNCCMFYELEQPAETEKTTTVRNGDFNLGATKEVVDWIGK